MPGRIYLTKYNGSHAFSENADPDECSKAVMRWTQRKRTWSVFRTGFLVLIYSISLGVIVRKIVMRTTSTETQTYSRPDWWWKGAGDDEDRSTEIGVQCSIERNGEARGHALNWLGGGASMWDRVSPVAARPSLFRFETRRLSSLESDS